MAVIAKLSDVLELFREAVVPAVPEFLHGVPGLLAAVVDDCCSGFANFCSGLRASKQRTQTRTGS